MWLNMLSSKSLDNFFKSITWLLEVSVAQKRYTIRYTCVFTLSDHIICINKYINNIYIILKRCSEWFSPPHLEFK